MLDLVAKLENRLAAIDREMAEPGAASDQRRMIELGRERRRVEDVLAIGPGVRDLTRMRLLTG